MASTTSLAVYFRYPLVEASHVLPDKVAARIEAIEEKVDVDEDEYSDEEDYRAAVKTQVLLKINEREIRAILTAMNSMFGTKYKLTKKKNELWILQ